MAEGVASSSLVRAEAAKRAQGWLAGAEGSDHTMLPRASPPLQPLLVSTDGLRRCDNPGLVAACQVHMIDLGLILSCWMCLA